MNEIATLIDELFEMSTKIEVSILESYGLLLIADDVETFIDYGEIEDFGVSASLADALTEVLARARAKVEPDQRRTPTAGCQHGMPDGCCALCGKNSPSPKWRV